MVVITKDYLHCYKKELLDPSTVGSFLFKVKCNFWEVAKNIGMQVGGKDQTRII